MSQLPVISWFLEMEWRLQMVFVFCCLTLNTYLFVSCRLRSREYWLDVFFKMFGASYFSLFIFHRISEKVIFYLNNPDYPISFWYWVNWGMGMMMFLLFLAAYITRSNPVARANRLREIIYPLFCGTLPMLVFESFSFGRYEFVRNSEILVMLFRPFADVGPGYWSVLSIVLITFGHIISVWALFYLRRSFGIFTEVRSLVVDGPYRYVRHPLYVGESIAAIGFCLLLPSWFNILITVLFLLCQRLRAYFEEQKFLQAVPEYSDFIGRAGAYFPRMGNKAKSGGQDV